jgi:hypothetical protein
VILRVHAAGSSERDGPTRISEHTDRASDLLRRERERASVVVGIGVAFCGESEWCLKEKT